MSDDLERVLLLLTDILGDLNITDSNSVFWTPESVQKELEKEGGLELASDLLQRLQNLQGTTTSIPKLESWETLPKNFPVYYPPWVTERDLAKKPLLAKSEILCFLASTLQNKLVGRKKSTSTQSQTPTPPISSTSSSSSTPSDPLLSSSLPAHLTQDQRELIIACYESMKADYDKRRVSMKQRLDILVSNFEADNPNDPDMAALKQSLQGLSLTAGASYSYSSSPVTTLDETELIQHFLTPHSKGLGRRTPIPKSGTNPLDCLTVVDRGGRTDERESRIVMPKWQ